MLRADRNAAMLAGLICSAAGMKSKQTGKVLTAGDFDVFNRDPEAPKELSMEHMFAVLSGSKG